MDVYGQRKAGEGFENDPYGFDNGLGEDAADFKRLENGMVVNEDREQMRKQNMEIAMKGAAIAMGGGYFADEN